MLALILSLCVSVDGGEAGLMRQNLTALFVLQRYLVSPATFRDPENAGVITASLDTLALLQHQLTDPTPKLISELMADRVKQARTDFQRGSRDAARLRLKGLTSLCLGCHTRAPAAVAPSTLTTEHLELTPAERAYLLAAVRQFDPALEQWRQLLAEPARSRLDSYEQVLALRSALGLAVRAKDDPQLALDLLALVKGREDLAPFAKRNITEWAKQATAWKGERFVAAAQTPAALFARAKALVESTPAFTSVAGDDDHLVVLHRAIAYLNLALEREGGAAWRGEAIYLLAVASAAALDPELWQLDGLYLEACVREYPHTKLAVKCVDRLADRTIYQFTLDGVTRVPLEDGSRLGRLRALAR